MNRHKCKVCMKNFNNGRALGGHMRSHLLPLTPSKRARNQQLTESASSSSNSQLLQLEVIEGKVENGLEKNWVGLRDDPKRKKKKSVKASDPGFLDVGSSVVEEEDRESETTEIIQNSSDQNHSQSQGMILAAGKEVQIASTTSVTDMSCVSDGPTDEEVALCLMMLSKDKWVSPLQDKSLVNNRNYSSSELLKPDNNNNNRKPCRPKYKCLNCNKNFRSHKALTAHQASNQMCQDENTVVEGSGKTKKTGEDQKIYECPFCFKVFGSGQALGGHKRSHLLGTPPTATTTTTTSIPAAGVDKAGNCLIDLNFPAPIEDEKLSVIH